MSKSKEPKHKELTIQDINRAKQQAQTFNQGYTIFSGVPVVSSPLVPPGQAYIGIDTEINKLIQHMQTISPMSSPKSYTPPPFTMEDLYEDMPDYMVELVKEWHGFLLDPDNRDPELFEWCFKEAKGKFYIHADYDEKDGIWFENKDDALYAKLKWGGDQ